MTIGKFWQNPSIVIVCIFCFVIFRDLEAIIFTNDMQSNENNATLNPSKKFANMTSLISNGPVKERIKITT